jgi:hypothetical protein
LYVRSDVLTNVKEFLGDWANLLGHGKAAYQILTDIFKPETVMQDETRRKIASWYTRLDLLAGIVGEGGGERKLSREWFAAIREHYRRQSRDRPDELSAKLEDLMSSSGLLAKDSSLLLAAKKRGVVSDKEYESRTRELEQQYADLSRRVETSFAKPGNCAKSFPNAPPPDEAEIIHYQDSNLLYTGELFTMNYIMLDSWAIDLNFKHQRAIQQQQTPTPEIEALGSKMCKMIEAIECSGPNGALLCCQTSLAIASLFLPKDEKHTDWCRRKYAKIEQLGYVTLIATRTDYWLRLRYSYVYPPALRQHVSSIWGVDVTRWWLPDDEGYPISIREVRDFIAYRARANPSPPTRTIDPHVQEMGGIFQKMSSRV